MTGCGPATSEKTDFEQYLDAIPELELPLTIRCDGDFNWFTGQIPEEPKDRFIPSNGSPGIMGKITFNDTISGVIYLYPADSELPILKTYRLSGILIDSLQMIDQYCGLEYESEGYSWINIQDDQIELSDTTRYWERDENHEKIPNTDRTERRYSLFQVASDGKIGKTIPTR